MKLTVLPATPERWSALEDLFGKCGASNGCWCMYWRIGSLYRQRPREMNRAALREIVLRGPPPGMLAFDGEKAVGWCQLTPRDDVPWIDRARALSRVDDVPVWSISCFYVRRGCRGHGVTSVLIEAALQAARSAGAPAVEAYPWDATKAAPACAYTGFASTFARAGFVEVARRKAARPIMRHVLEPTERRESGSDGPLAATRAIDDASPSARLRAPRR
jgi:GNAT superfamily N-acetyltransferase